MRICFAFLVVIGWVGPAAAQVDVRLPDIEGDPGDEVMIPVQVSDVTGSNVTGFWLKLVFDPSVIEVTGTVLDGSVAEGSLASTNAATEGEFVVACATANTRPLSGSGVLIYLTARLVAEGYSVLQFDEFIFNDEGIPEARLFGGSVTSGTPTKTEEDEEPRGAFSLHGHFPEPAKDEVTIRFDTFVPGPVHVRVVDMLGREVAAAQFGWNTSGGGAVPLRVSHLAGGTYIYSMTSGGYTANRLLTVSR